RRARGLRVHGRGQALRQDRHRGEVMEADPSPRGRAVNRLSYAAKRVVVTGAASGIGAATARLVAELGAMVVVLDVKKPAEGAGEWIETNLASRESIDVAVARIGDLGKKIDAVFNCAGLPGPPF